MLVPAVTRAAELAEAFAKECYTDDYFYYIGEGHIHGIRNFAEPYDNQYDWAVVDNDNNLVGFITYYVDKASKCASRFGLYSFKKGNLTVGKDLYKLMEELYSLYHRIEYRMVSGNHTETAYDNFCKRHNGRKLVLRDVCTDNYGKLHDSYIYEVINPDVK